MILQPVSVGGSGAALLLRWRWNIPLLGVKNGSNNIFTTPEDFVESGEVKIRVYYNGVRLYQGVSNDFVTSESGGAGTGFDTITLNGFFPLSKEQLTADYLVP